MSYAVIMKPAAERHLARWRRSGQTATLERIAALLDELREHPTWGLGKPERLRGNYSGLWSRRIDRGNRLVYSVDDGVVTVAVLSLLGHYDNL